MSTEKFELPVCRVLPERIEMRAAAADGAAGTPAAKVMSGHFSVFNNWYEINSSFEGQFLERVAPGAFRKTLNDNAGRKNAAQQIKVLFDHGHDPLMSDKPMGLPRSLGEDEIGPSYEVELFNGIPELILSGLEAGAYGSSFRFQVVHDEWNDSPERSEYNPNGIPERTVKEVRCMEFGPTPFPANPEATAGVRSGTDRFYDKIRSKSPELYEEALRSARGSFAVPRLRSNDNDSSDDNDQPDDGAPETGGKVDESETCPACGTINDGDAKYCDQCGADLPDPPEDSPNNDPDDTLKCPSCGLMNASDSQFCDQCGVGIFGELNSEPTGGEERDMAEGAGGMSDSEAPLQCASCGTVNKPLAKKCKQCGKGLDQVQNRPKDPAVALVMAEANSEEPEGEDRADSVSDSPWDFKASDYSPEQWKAACLVHLADDSESKSDHKLPVREPSGKLNRNGCHAAAGRIDQVQAPGDVVTSAAKSLLSIYKNQLSETPPDSLVKLAARSGTSVIAEAATVTTEPRKHSSANSDTTTQNRSMTMSGDKNSMTVEERTARQAEIEVRMSSIGADYNDVALPVEVQTEWDSLDAELEEHRSTAKAIEARRARLTELAAKPANQERGSDFGAPAFIAKRDNIYDISAMRTEARSLDDMGRLMKDNARRAVDAGTFPSARSADEAKEVVHRLLDTLSQRDNTENESLAKRLLVTGNPAYDRAFGKYLATGGINTMTDEERTALAMGAGATGSFAVPFELDPTVILTSTGVINPIRQLARTVQITGKTWEGVTSAGVVVSRALEAAEATDNSPTLVQPSVTPKRVQGFVPFSYEVDQDWTMLRSELGKLIADAKNVEEASAFVLGSGTDPHPQGIVTALAAGSPLLTATTATFAAADVYAVENAINPRFRPNASWLASKTTYNTIRQFGATFGANMWERIGAGQPPVLLGYPAYEESVMDSTTTTGSNLAVFGDFSHFLIVDKIGMNVELVPMLFGATNRYPTGQRGMYAFWRNSCLTLNSNAFQLLQVK